MALFSPLPTPSNAQSSPSTTATSNNNGTTGAEALLLQSFADSNWAQPNSLNNGMGGMGMGMGLGGSMNSGIESGPMEVDTGFFSSDMQRRLFW